MTDPNSFDLSGQSRGPKESFYRGNQSYVATEYSFWVY